MAIKLINTNFVGTMMFPSVCKFVRDPKRRAPDTYSGIIEFGAEDDGAASLPVTFAHDLANGGGSANASTLAANVPEAFRQRSAGGNQYYTGYALFLCRKNDLEALLALDNGIEVTQEGTYTSIVSEWDTLTRKRKKFEYPAKEIWGKNAVRLYGSYAQNAPNAFGVRAYAGTRPLNGIDSEIWKITLVESPYPDGIVRHRRKTYNFEGIVAGVIETRRMAWGNPASYAEALAELGEEIDNALAEDTAEIERLNALLQAVDDNYSDALSRYAAGQTELQAVHAKYDELPDTEENDIAYQNELQAIWIKYSDDPSWTPTDDNGNARPLPSSVLLGTTPAAKRAIDRRPLLEERRIAQQERNREAMSRNARLERLEAKLIRDEQHQGESLKAGRTRIFNEKLADLQEELHGIEPEDETET